MRGPTSGMMQRSPPPSAQNPHYIIHRQRRPQDIGVYACMDGFCGMSDDDDIGDGRSSARFVGKGNGPYRQQHVVKYEYVGEGSGDIDLVPKSACNKWGIVYFVSLPLMLLPLLALVHDSFPSLRLDALAFLFGLVSLVGVIFGAFYFCSTRLAGTRAVWLIVGGLVAAFTFVLPVYYYLFHADPCCKDAIPACDACREAVPLESFCAERPRYESCPYLGHCLRKKTFTHDESQFCCYNFRISCLGVISGHIRNGIGTLAGHADNSLKGVHAHLTNAADHIASIQMPHEMMAGHFDRFGNWVLDSASQAHSQVEEAHTQVRQHTQGFGNWVKDSANDAGNVAKAHVDKLGDHVGKAANNLGTVADKLHAGVQKTRDHIGYHQDQFGNWVEDTAEEAHGHVVHHGTRFGNAVSDGARGVGQAATDIASTAEQGLSQARDHIGYHQDKFGNWVKDTAEEAKGHFDSAGNWIADTSNSVVDSLDSAATHVRTESRGHFNKFGKWISDTFGEE